jgi:uncharacterized protein DUF992
MSMRAGWIAAATLALVVAAIGAPPVGAAEGGVKAGYLKCDVAGNVSFIFGSSRDISCVYTAGDGKRKEHYSGEIKKYGLDIGFQENGVIVWAVFAPANDVGPGALAGDFAGGSGSVAAGYGVGANALFGGGNKSIALQPVSIEGIKGLNLAAAIAVLTLRGGK